MRSAIGLLLLGACATYTGSGRSVDAARLSEPGWIKVERVEVVKQQHDWDCGVAALATVLSHYGVEPEVETIAASIRPAAEAARPIKAGELRDVARRHGLRAFIFPGGVDDLRAQLAAGRPVLVGMRKPTLAGSNAHYEVVVGLHDRDRTIMTIDPGLGLRENSFTGFDEEWAGSGRLILLVLAPELRGSR